jgi:hypothetical protein
LSIEKLFDISLIDAIAFSSEFEIPASDFESILFAAFNTEERLELEEISFEFILKIIETLKYD